MRLVAPQVRSVQATAQKFFDSLDDHEHGFLLKTPGGSLFPLCHAD